MADQYARRVATITDSAATWEIHSLDRAFAHHGVDTPFSGDELARVRARRARTAAARPRSTP